MLNYDYKKEYSLPIEPSLRAMRIKMSPQVELENENMFIVDDLESTGVIKIMEHIGGTLYVPIEADQMESGTANTVFLAEIRVSTMSEMKEVKLESIIYEYGYDELTHELFKQVLFFADFYDCRVSILNLKKKQRSYSKKTSIAVGR